MGLVSKPYTFVNDTTADGTEVNSDFDTLYTLVNGNLDSDNLAAGAVGMTEIADDAVNFNKIDWGTGANQVRGTETTTWRLGQGLANYLDLASPALTGNRTWTLQDTSDTFVGRATTDTLTNKSLTSPTITGTVGGSAAYTISGGSIDGVSIGATTPASGAFTSTRISPSGAGTFTATAGTQYTGHLAGTVLTTDATQTTLVTITLGEDQALTVETVVSAILWGGAKGYHAVFMYGARKDGAAAVSEIMPNSLLASANDDSSIFVDCTWSVSGNDVLLQVTGDAGQIIQWTACVRYTIVDI